jgi:hypothetical protein
MRHLSRGAVSLLLAALLALAAVSPVLAGTLASPSAAPAAAYQEGEEEDENDVVPVAVWTTVGVVAGAVVFGVLYLFKRRIGGFPKNPSWVAPISIERSETFPDEGDFGDVAPGAHH